MTLLPDGQGSYFIEPMQLNTACSHPTAWGVIAGLSSGLKTVLDENLRETGEFICIRKYSFLPKSVNDYFYLFIYLFTILYYRADSVANFTEMI